MLTSSSSQPSRLGDSLVLSNTGVGLVRNGLPVEITQQSEDVRAHEVAIDEQRRAKEICDADRARFRQFYDDELRRKRSKQFLSGERPRGGPKKTFQAGEGGVESNKAAQENLRARQEQRAKDDQLRESTKLARQRARQQQRVKDDQLRESRKVKQARDDSTIGALLRHEADIETRRRQGTQLRDAALSEEARSRDVERVARVDKRRALQGLEDDHRRRERSYRDDASARAIQRHEAAL
ncbi:hypothetical protein V501_03139 [Pseudogymnoascus sp. VKM F-4519 (FW-2642)]|nr:hypothetical protein V501_03139 [Pseudogymnoascus sp. VKM F-4519 (FW-2642)]